MTKPAGPIALRAIPAVALQALERMSDPDLSIRELAGLLRNDPAIVSRLLTVANSAACGLRMKVTDVEQVVVLLGKPAVISIVLSIALAPGDIPATQRDHYRRYWSDSVMMATSAELLAKNADVLKHSGLNPAEYFTCGLLADVGRLALLQNRDIDYPGVLRYASEHGLFPREVEQDDLGTTHVEASLVLLNTWNAPDFVQAAVRHHHDSVDALEDDDEPEHLDVVHALVFSAAMVDYLTGPAKAALLERLVMIGERTLGFTESEVEDHIGAVLDRLEETAELFTIQSTEIHAIRDRFRAGLDAAAMASATEHVRACRRREEPEVQQEDNAEVTVRASRDELTQLFNQDYFQRCLQRHLDETPTPVGLVYLDVDRFENLTAEHDTAVGNKVLSMVAQVLRKSLRPSDVAARYENDDFIVLMPSASVLGLETVAERLRRAITAAGLVHDGKTFSITVSVGAALSYSDAASPATANDFIEKARAAMQIARRTKREAAHIVELRMNQLPTIGGDRTDRYLAGLGRRIPDVQRN